MQQSDCVLQKLQLNTVTRRSCYDIDRGATLRHAWSIHLKEEKKKTLMVMNVETIALAETTVDTDGITFDGLIKNTQTIMSDNHNRICAWCQSKGKTMFANLPNKSS